MPDVFTKARRSEVMSRIRGRGNKETELALMRLLRLHRITGWRRQIQITVGSSRGDETQTGRGPLASGSIRASSRRLLRVRVDFVFREARLALFVDGCFWHGCPEHSNMPANNRAFWKRKLAGNKLRDRVVNRILRAGGWRVLRIWQHHLASRKEARCVRRILKALARI